MRESWDGNLNGLAKCLHQPLDYRRRFIRKILSKDGQNSQFKTIPCARHAQSWPLHHHSCKSVVAGKIGSDMHRVRAQIEKTPRLLHNLHQVVAAGQEDPHG